MALKQGNQNQYDCKLFFGLDGTCNSQWSNYLTQRARILSPRSNVTPQRAKETVNDLLWCLRYRKRAKAGWLHGFLSCFPENSKLQSAVYPEW